MTILEHIRGTRLLAFRAFVLWLSAAADLQSAEDLLLDSFKEMIRASYIQIVVRHPLHLFSVQLVVFS